MIMERIHILVIDDERTFANCIAEYARNSCEGLAAVATRYTEYSIRYGDRTQIWLDHDLGNGDDIRVVVDFLSLLNPDFCEKIFVHSQNPTTDWIVTCLENVGYDVQRSILPNLNRMENQ